MGGYVDVNIEPVPFFVVFRPVRVGNIHVEIVALVHAIVELLGRPADIEAVSLSRQIVKEPRFPPIHYSRPDHKVSAFPREVT
ncbi:hypothetical protein LCGC14_2304050 [marine sediment metagenome]|uniref:Uncharacterized protein n=1 Tax=marine sediment metagenome TaxID=412755 RepID=A0A0F9FHJ1_9ZZZZ